MALDQNQQVQRLVIIGAVATLSDEDQAAIRHLKQEILALAETAKEPEYAIFALSLAGLDYADKYEG